MDNEPSSPSHDMDAISRNAEMARKRLSGIARSGKTAASSHPDKPKFSMRSAIDDHRKATSFRPTNINLGKNVDSPPKASANLRTPEQPARSAIPSVPDDYPDSMKELPWKDADLDKWKPDEEDSYDWLETDESGGWRPRPQDDEGIAQPQPDPEVVPDPETRPCDKNRRRDGGILLR